MFPSLENIKALQRMCRNDTIFLQVQINY